MVAPSGVKGQNSERGIETGPRIGAPEGAEQVSKARIPSVELKLLLSGVVLPFARGVKGQNSERGIETS